MIFVTVGTDLPFDRLIRVIDGWASDNGRRDVFAQIGEGGWEPDFIEFSPFLEPSAFAGRCAAASVIIAHAGMGTILSALHSGKPLLVMPRRASLGEQRNEHQLATARYMQEQGKVSVAFDEEELRDNLDNLNELAARPPIGSYASKSLTGEIRDFIFQGTLPDDQVSPGATRSL